VYVVFLPATGVVSMILPVFARRPIVGYSYVALSTVLTGVVGMGVWAHHMFAVGMSHLSMRFFGAAGMMISVFGTVQVFAWLSTLWHGRPMMTTALRFALGFIALFVFGGLSGVATAIVPLDWRLMDAYFVVAQPHYVLLAANVFPVFAALYYWWPKMTGRLPNDRVGGWSFWTMFVGFTVAYFPMHLAGLAGMPRRIFTYPAGMGWDGLKLLSTAGAFVFGVGILLGLANLVVSARRGMLAGSNPWNADTLEWAVPSPPPPFNWLEVPTVRSRHPLWDGRGRSEFGDRSEQDEGRATTATTSLEARLDGISKMPEDTLVPLLLALALTGCAAALLARLTWAAAGLMVAMLLLSAIWLWPSKEAERA
jgi:heme/copper-type cytochrome/quinol oxidase subunit 1